LVDKQSKAAASAAANRANSQVPRGASQAKHNAKTWSHLFSRMATSTAQFAGKPLAFVVAVLVVAAWAITGPLFDYSDTWQLVINTSTTIVTFLMVFLIQHTQNRDTLVLQLKLSELIIAVRQAENQLATIEDMTEEELEELHEQFRRRSEEALRHLSQRRGQKSDVTGQGSGNKRIPSSDV
jgi:low affinity Fe/Cu permease